MVNININKIRYIRYNKYINNVVRNIIKLSKIWRICINKKKHKNKSKKRNKNKSKMECILNDLLILLIFFILWLINC